MGFKDLEHKLENFFHKESRPYNISQKTRIKEQVLMKYSAKKTTNWQYVLSVFSSKYSTSAIGLMVLIAFVPFANNQLYAGEISSDAGLVEIIRNGKKIIIDRKSKLKVGDEIIVNSNANAQVSLRNNFESEVLENSKVTIKSNDNIFLVEGTLNNNLKQGKISTNKGEISAKNPSDFSVDVSGSGETKIIPQKNHVFVKNWQGEEVKLTSGEELRLRTDTELNTLNIPKGIGLSNAQIQAIRSKLFIARTKALNYVEKTISKDYKEAVNDLKSAKKTFKSIAQVLKISRDLQKSSPSENIDMLNINDIYDRLVKKTNNQDILDETKAVEALMNIIENKKTFNFEFAQTDSLSFDRYVIVSRLFANESAEIQELGNILRKQYVISFAKKIFNEELKIDQISVLNLEIKKLPKTTIAKYFLIQVKEIFPIDLQNLLTEKMNKDF